MLDYAFILLRHPEATAAAYLLEFGRQGVQA